jgi:ribonuclease BN (tRNA processing enzyme)
MFDSCKVLLDCSPTTLQALKENKISTNEIDYIFVSHFHGDHIVGIPFFFLDCYYISQRRKPITIIGSKGIEDKINELYHQLYPSVSLREHPFLIKYIEMDLEDNLIIDSLNITTHGMNHRPESVGFKIKHKNYSLAYTGDTGLGDNIIPLIKDTTVSIIECSFFKLELDTHLNFNQIKDLIRYSDFIILTHLGESVRKNISENSLPKKLKLADDNQLFTF